MPSGRFINLRAKPFQESDLILEVLSKEGERLTLTAKNAIKSKKRFGGGVLEPLNFFEAQYTEAKNGYLYLQEAEIIYGFGGLRKDYLRLQTGLHFLQLIAKGAREGLQDNKALFDLLGNSLKALESTTSIEQLKLQFELKYLYYLGFLALNKDSEEFVHVPVSDHAKIHLTDEELTYLKHYVRQQLKELDLLLKAEH